jgi:hypothetical protein
LNASFDALLRGARKWGMSVATAMQSLILPLSLIHPYIFPLVLIIQCLFFHCLIGAFSQTHQSDAGTLSERLGNSRHSRDAGVGTS